MTCFCGSHCQGNSLIVTHLTYEDNVGVFTESTSQGIAERINISADFTLVDSCLFLSVFVFNGVFDSDNVAGTVLVDIVNDRLQEWLIYLNL